MTNEKFEELQSIKARLDGLRKAKQSVIIKSHEDLGITLINFPNNDGMKYLAGDRWKDFQSIMRVEIISMLNDAIDVLEQQFKNG